MKEHERDLKEVNQSGEDFLHEAKVCSHNINNQLNSVIQFNSRPVCIETAYELCFKFTWKPKYLNLCVFGVVVDSA